MLKFYFKLFLYSLVLLTLSTARADPAVEFFRAVNTDDAGTVKALLDRGFDPNTLSEKGQVGLYLAFRDESPKVVAALLAHPKTRLDAVNAADETPLMMAALRGQVDGVRQLLDRGASLNRPGWTPLHYAASGPGAGGVALLLERGARLEALSPNRTTPLMMAARYGPEAAVDLLLARGASLQARNDAGLGAVDFALLAGREALAQRLQAATR
ncbi:MAG: ankyrin repeat domain-containing protein [Rubrivivax sp.]|nr:ankyrin repeat domain-containing protein [Rubrivivax sp.]